MGKSFLNASICRQTGSPRDSLADLPGGRFCLRIIQDWFMQFGIAYAAIGILHTTFLA